MHDLISKIRLPEYIDSSARSKWSACHRQYFWAICNSLSPTGRSIHLTAGGALAAGMEAARRVAFAPGRHRRATHDDLLEAAYPAFAEQWGDFSAEEDHPKSFSNTFQALEAYLEHYPPQEDPIQPLIRPDGTPAVEFTFSIPLEEELGFPLHPETGNPFLFTGRFDLLGSYNGLPCVLDEKTTSALGPTWVAQWNLRGQFMGYCWACRQLGYPVSHAAVRGIALLKREYKFETAIVQFPTYLIDRWAAQLCYDLHQLVGAYKLVKANPADLDLAFPFNFADACSSYGGCAFATLCSVNNPEDFLNNYVKYLWDPLAKQPMKEAA